MGASFVLIEGVEGCNSSLSVVEDGCVARLTTEQFKALLSHIRSASPLQIRIETARGLPTTSSFNGGLITVNWIDEPAPIHFTSLHVGLPYILTHTWSSSVPRLMVDWWNHGVPL